MASSVSVVHNLDYWIGPDQLNQLKLFLYFHENTSDGDVEKAKHLSDLLDILKQIYHPEDLALAVLKYMLDLVGIPNSEKLEVSEESQKSCQELIIKNLAYPSLIVSVCKDMKEDDFDNLRCSICSTILERSHTSITSCDSLFVKLHHKVKRCDELQILVNGLTKIGRTDLAHRIGHFIETNTFRRSFGETVNWQSPNEETTQGAEGRTRPVYGQNQQLVPGEVSSSQGQSSDDFRPENREVRGNTEQYSNTEPTEGDGAINIIVSGAPTSNLPMSSGQPPPSIIESQISFGAQTPVQETGIQPQQRVSRSDTSSSEDIHFEEQPNASSEERCLLSPIEVSRESSTELRTRQPFINCKCTRRKAILITFCIVLPLSVLGLAIAFSVIGSTPTNPTNPFVFATGGETVIVAEIDDTLPLISYSLRECLATGDIAHFTQVYKVPGEKLQRHSRSMNKLFDVFNQTGPNCMFNLLTKPLYMLKCSSLKLEICLSSDTVRGDQGSLLIFNNHEAYDFFETVGDCQQTDGADCMHNLNIGALGNFVCTNITYEMDSNGYMYMILSTPPGNIYFHYRYKYVQYYLDPDDFRELECTIISTGDNNCKLGESPSDGVCVVAYIKANTAINSHTTHLCLDHHWSVGQKWLVGLLFSSLCLVFCLCTSLCTACLCKCYQARKNTSHLIH